jgi:hypothetical protein
VSVNGNVKGFVKKESNSDTNTNMNVGSATSGRKSASRNNNGGLILIEDL